MSDYGSRGSTESRGILLGDFGVESFIEDYAVLAIRAAGDSQSTSQIYTQWVYDENRHSKALWYGLNDSGLYSHRELDEYSYQCGQNVWTFERQTDHEATPERGAAYDRAQERQNEAQLPGDAEAPVGRIRLSDERGWPPRIPGDRWGLPDPLG